MIYSYAIIVFKVCRKRSCDLMDDLAQIAFLEATIWGETCSLR